MHHHGSGCVFAASLAAALALGFCAADAAVIAKMSATHALRYARAAGRGAGAVRPHGGFGLRPELLPSLHPSPDSPTKAFPALSDPRLGLYAVVDSADWVERVLAAGVRTVQLRIKEGARAHLSREVSRSVLAAHRARAQLFINDHWELAIENGAYGVHLGQEDRRSADMDALRSAGLRVGLSTHSYWEVCRAHAWAPSYIASGPRSMPPPPRICLGGRKGPAILPIGAMCCARRWLQSPAWTSSAALKPCSVAPLVWRCCAASCKPATRHAWCTNCNRP